MEIELFGVDRAEGQEGRKPGALEEAHGGTLFIDDIADLPRETQNKILARFSRSDISACRRQH